MSFIIGPPTASQPQHLAHILIVDDVPQNLTAMEALLARDGVNVLKASSGAEALELLLQFDVALALLDVQMPEMDGFTLAELMRGSSRTRHVPIIFLTASPSDPARSFKGYDTGAVDFLHKPIEPRVIAGKVDVFIELYRHRIELQKRNEQLEHSLGLNETMIAVLTHDLRMPLTAISLCADRLLEETAKTELARTASFVRTSADRMARMIEQMLDFSRIRSSIVTLDLQAGDLGRICADAVDEIRRAHPDRSIELSTHGDLLSSFDEVRMGQVVTNLLGNAVEHGKGANISVAVDGSQPEMLVISVQNGGRISEALLPRLFEPFKGAFNPSEGLGLGLYIVDQFVRAHGGSVRAENLESDSVRFEVRLPRRTVRRIEQGSAGGTRALQGRIILVTEDDPVIGHVLVDILEDAGASVLGPFPSLQVASAALASQVPDAALLDVNLVDGDVYPLAECLQQSKVPFVLLSGSHRAQVPTSLQPRAFLSKPASTRDIVAAVSDMLEHG
jgi:signal transduction histidine kinase